MIDITTPLADEVFAKLLIMGPTGLILSRSVAIALGKLDGKPMFRQDMLMRFTGRDETLFMMTFIACLVGLMPAILASSPEYVLDALATLRTEGGSRGWMFTMAALVHLIATPVVAVALFFGRKRRFAKHPHLRGVPDFFMG